MLIYFMVGIYIRLTWSKVNISYVKNRLPLLRPINVGEGSVEMAQLTLPSHRYGHTCLSTN